ncbi:MAG TPA: Wzz/FepE/Etk N-terminal domain-containing protein [Bryobacteraceae bacterium]|nr:Wzz/FepE/Etk N-terminal domain-containing protein [Bryobacteraceae bacterium]
MSNMVDQPDLELMLRGRPLELPSVRVQIVPPASSGVPRHATNFLAALRRHRGALGIFAAVGALLGLSIALLHRPWYEARAAIAPPPSENAEVEVKQLTDPDLVAASLAKAQLESLPEYSRGSSAIDGLRSILRIEKKPEAGELLRTVLRNLSVTASPQGRVVDIAFRATDAQRAAAFVNFLTSGFQDLEIKLRSLGAAGAKDPLGDQIAEAKAAQQRAEDDLVAYAHAARLALDPQSGALVENRFAQVKNNIAGLESKFPAGSPEAGEARKLADALRRAQAEYAAARNEKAIRFQAKKQDLETKRAIYDALLKKRQAVLAEVNAEKTSHVLVAAHVPGDAIRPSALLYLMYGLLGGLMVGACFCAVRESRDTKLHGPGDIAAYVNVVELGTVPHMKLDEEPGAALHGGHIIDLSPTAGAVQKVGGANEFVAVNGLGGLRYPVDPGESFRSVLASIWIAGQNSKRPRVMVFTSPGDGEGKTSIVTNLGIALANTNRRVLILEADLRHPRLHKVFGKPEGWGLANMLAEESPVEEYRFEDLTLKTDIPGLYVLPAGTGETNIASMRYVDRLGELLTRFRLEFHAVLIDTPGALEFPDARVIGRLSDGAVLVFRSGATEREQAAALGRRFQEDGINVLGAVLNDYRSG